ncbi:MAG: YceD family protein [Bacillota bacterium]
MKINVESIKETLGAIKQVDLEFPFADLTIQGRNVSFVDDISFVGRAINSEDEFIVTGTINSKIKVPCSRCLEEFTSSLEFDFEAEFSRTEIENDELDLEESLVDHITLAVPMKTVCDEDCQGLCPSCGINLNDDDCDCMMHEVDPRLAKLEKLLDEEE